MFLRRSLSLFLVGIGIGSPWLVRDWLAANAAIKSARGDAVAETGWVERIREKLRQYGGDSPEDHTPEVAEAGERKPYPLAAHSRRLVEGFFGGSGKGGGLGAFLPAGGGEPPSTTRSRAITEETERHLAPELAKLGLRSGNPVVLRLFKEESELEVWMKPDNDPHYKLFKVRRIVASSGRPGPKLREGDGQAPEGFYTAASASLRPETKHHLGIDFGYPNELDRYLGRSGSDLTIHAGENAAGGFALSPETMNEIYTLTDAALRAGQGQVAIHLFPFRLTDARMDRVVAEGSRWTDVWVDLKEGYDFFENVRLPPAIVVENGKYAFRIIGK